MVRTDLLETLKEFLKTIPSEKFDLNTWRNNLQDSRKVSDLDLMTECGTTACAMGWAATLPEFKKEGLSCGVMGLSFQNPKIEDNDFFTGFSASAHVFGFRRIKTARCLFSKLHYERSQYTYVGPERVVARIERLLKLLELPEGMVFSDSDLYDFEYKAEGQFHLEVETNRI
ncbi:hypothetical protein EAb13_CDS0029 [Acinetobacter phage EAb13]|nr:hypothetical protein EAb13_CDS0029 [Acinetobacter phage EAb13]